MTKVVRAILESLDSEALVTLHSPAFEMKKAVAEAMVIAREQELSYFAYISPNFCEVVAFLRTRRVAWRLAFELPPSWEDHDIFEASESMRGAGWDLQVH